MKKGILLKKEKLCLLKFEVEIFAQIRTEVRILSVEWLLLLIPPSFLGNIDNWILKRKQKFRRTSGESGTPPKIIQERIHQCNKHDLQQSNVIRNEKPCSTSEYNRKLDHARRD